MGGSNRLAAGRRAARAPGAALSSLAPLTQAAALPWRLTTEGIEIMLVTTRGRGHWILPKGWAEPGESLSEAAAREALEEAGLTGAVSNQEFGRYFYVKDAARDPLPCHVSVFPLRVTGVAHKWKESRQRARKWMTASEAIASVREPDLRALLTAFFEAAGRSVA